MALDKLVDSSKLDAALNYEANRILAKTGISVPITFDFDGEKGFGDIIDTISTQGVLNISQDSEGYLVLDSASAPYAGTIAISSDSAGGDIISIHTIDLSGDTIVASALVSGYTAHDSRGQAIVGSYVELPIWSGGSY